MSEETANCTICKQPLGANGRCPHCDEDTHVWTIQDWRPLLTLSLAIVLGFSFTSLVVSSFHEKQSALAAEYAAAGSRTMDEWARGVRKNPAPAVHAFEAALVYSHDNLQYQMKLTDALVATGATNEAFGQLHALWEQHPGDALVNLKLARLEAHRQRVDDALRYYQKAIEGEWPEHTDPVAQRVGALFESAEYLLALGRHEQTETVLALLADALPNAAPERAKLAGLYLRNGDAGRALSMYQALLLVNRKDAVANLGAARASFAAGSYATARRYLEAVNPETAESQALLAQVEHMEALDPFAHGATSQIRARRTVAAFRIAAARLSKCVAPSAEVENGKAGAAAADPAQWSGFTKWAEQLTPMMDEHRLRGRDDVIESAMRFAFQVEIAAQKGCGTATPDDEALLLLARERLGASQ